MPNTPVGKGKEQASETPGILPGAEFPVPKEPDVIDVSAVSAFIGEHAAPYVEKEDATDRWLAERGGGGRKESGAVDPPKVPRETKKHRKPGPPLRLRDGDSGLDPHWNVHPDAMTPEEAERYRAGVLIAKGALAEVTRPDEPENNDTAEAWSLTREQKADMIRLSNDARAKYIPKSIGELSFAKKMLGFLAPDPNKPDIVGRYFIETMNAEKDAQLKAGLNEAEASAEADSVALQEAMRIHGYWQDSMQTLATTKQLSDTVWAIKRGGEAGLFSMSSLAEVAAQHPEIIEGIVRLSRGQIIWQTTAFGESPAGVDPFRNLSHVLHVVVKKLSDGGVDQKTKNGIIATYIQQWMSETTVEAVIEPLARSRQEESKRLAFWSRVNAGVPPEYRRDTVNLQ